MEATAEQHLDDTMKNPSTTGVLSPVQRFTGTQSGLQWDPEMKSVTVEQAAKLTSDPTDVPVVCPE